MADPIRILVVDDALEHAQMVVEFLRVGDTWRDAAMETAGSYEEALDALSTRPFDVAFFDYMLGARDGLTLLREIRRGIETPVVVLTSRGAGDVAVEAESGAADYLSKTNISSETLERTISMRSRCTRRNASAGRPKKRCAPAKNAFAPWSRTVRTRCC
jgi:DNA-binding response OmpR family regulator